MSQKEECNISRVKKFGRKIFKKQKDFEHIGKCAIINEDHNQVLAQKNMNPFPDIKHSKRLDANLDEQVVAINQGKANYLLCNVLYDKKSLDKMVKGIKAKTIFCSNSDPISANTGKKAPLQIENTDIVGFISSSFTTPNNDSISVYDDFIEVETMTKKDYEFLNTKEYSKSRLGKEIGLSDKQIRKSTKPQLILKYLRANKLTTDLFIDRR